MNNKPKPQSCTPVWAETGDCCFQACLQSFLADNGVQRSQREMVELGKQRGCCDAKGVIPYNQRKNPDYQNVVDFCKLFNIELKKIRDRRIPKNLKKHEGVLITPWNFKGTGSHHCLVLRTRQRKEVCCIGSIPAGRAAISGMGKGIHKGLVLRRFLHSFERSLS